MASNSSGSPATMSLASQSTCSEQDSPAYQNNNNNNTNTSNNNNSTARSPISKRFHANDTDVHSQQSQQQVTSNMIISFSSLLKLMKLFAGTDFDSININSDVHIFIDNIA